MYENVFEEKYWPPAIPKERLGILVEVELKIEDSKRNVLEWFHNLTGNMKNIDNVGEYPI